MRVIGETIAAESGMDMNIAIILNLNSSHLKLIKNPCCANQPILAYALDSQMVLGISLKKGAYGLFKVC